ncbi:hypothetical protein K1T71_010020 [Dendrolimus kikuchii]|uniref:Uncharacterized protein n=1 Tax=Dendrolimus kikuchii TaxID=765133 RepID=A0ACC1CUI4_9NEOP|nr:hypothetical protein K1T71_010020 [Dendrolimus kikuchii]
MDEIDQRSSQMAEEGVEGSPLQDLLQERREKRQSLGIDTSPKLENSSPNDKLHSKLD